MSDEEDACRMSEVTRIVEIVQNNLQDVMSQNRPHRYSLTPMSVALDLLILSTSWAHVLLAPYTKVEESFNLHSTHDVLMYGVGIDNLYNVRLQPQHH